MQRNPILEAIGDPSKNFLAFLLIGIFGLGILSSGISNLLLESLGNWFSDRFGVRKVLFQMVVIGIIGAAILFSVYFTNLARKLRSLFGRGELRVERVSKLTKTYSGLIAIPSIKRPGKETPAEVAINHHWNDGRGRLRYCWLICTKDSLESTKEFLREIQERCEARQLPFHIYYNHDRPLPKASDIAVSLHVQLIMLEPQQINDPNYIRQLIDEIYTEAEQQADLKAPNIIADYTGGTKSMTAGMVLACSEPDRSLEYFASRYDQQGNILDSQLTKVTLSYRIRAV